MVAHGFGEAQCAFEGAAAALLRPGMAVLDAACGAGVVARRLLAGLDGPIDVILLDAAPAMLDQCRDIPARRLIGRIEALPFPDQ
ncbi:methyltransferase domain-containing protein [Actibacterium sp. 188UL27-1]|nr:methyltransferase domain-containing protein [Actibacterium sp. 188UL27-1]